ncbi:hypothetical protein F6V25_05155 [Oryzomonas japonica]|uniref:Uncharacterized protein n=1 Tax=Oryzomonas japonica TaxID=2603858 RepID=A0A7J4ZU00_9BACT|nr:hypothetical protein [Oryzomonas japonica]KAB0666804.1 hypothetical protein F6V25_05155 [Oryzomonas japonica]
MQKLPPSEFRFGNYGADIPFDIYMDTGKLIEWMSARAVGYGTESEYRQIPGQVAVMFELEDFGRYWSHIPDYIFNEFLMM